MKIELKINGKAIELSEEIKEQIKKACGQVKIRPEEGEEFWFIEDDKVDSYNWEDTSYYNNYWNSGNGFFTKEEAEKELAKRQAIQRVKDYILENGMYWETDWNDDNKKYFFYYSYDIKGLIYDYQYCCKFYSPIGYLKSAEDAKKVLKDNKEDLEIIFK